MAKLEGLGENLLKELAPGDATVRGGQLLLALGLFQFEPECVENSLVAYLVQVARIAEERVHGSAWSKALGNHFEAQWSKALSQMACACSERQPTQGDENIFGDREGLIRLVHQTSQNCQNDAIAVANLNTDALELISGNVKRNFLTAIELIKEGFELAGIERSENLRLAKIELQEVLSDPIGPKCPTVQFLSGVLQSAAIYSGGDAPQLMSHALHLGFGSSVGLANLAHWGIGRAYLQKEEKSDALSHFGHVKVRKGEFMPWLDVARLQLEAGNTNRAREAISAALECSPLALIFLIADSAFEREAATIVSKANLLTASLLRSVKQKMAKLTDWEGRLSKAEAIYGSPLTLNLDLELTQLVSDQSGQPPTVLELLGHEVQIDRELDRKKAEANSNLERATSDREEAIAKKRVEIVKHEGKKAESIQRARNLYSQRLTAVQIELRKTEMEGVRAEKGCVWSFEYGLIMFGVYVVTVAVFAFGGNPEAYKSPLALLIAAAGVCPIVMAVIVNGSTMIRRGTAKAACASLQKEAKARLEEDLKSIDIEFEAETKVLNASIVEMTNDLGRVAQARAMLDPSPAQPKAA